MVRLLLLSTVALAACFGSLSPDRSPTGLGPPDDFTPPPPAPAVPPPPPVAIASIKVTDPGKVTAGSQVQITVVARNAAGAVVSLAAEQVYYFSYDPRVATVTNGGLIQAIAPGSTDIGVLVRSLGARARVEVTN